MSKETKPAVTRDSDKFMLRFPEGMRSNVSDAADHNLRSMNSEILARLERTFRWDAVMHRHPDEIASEIQATARRLQDLIQEFQMLHVDRDANKP